MTLSFDLLLSQDGDLFQDRVEVEAEHGWKSGLSADLSTKKITLESFKGSDHLDQNWVSMIWHQLYFVPQEINNQDLLRFMSDYFEGEMEEKQDEYLQIQRVNEFPPQLALSPLEDPEECVVWIFWKDGEGKTQFAPRKPLSDFP